MISLRREQTKLFLSMLKESRELLNKEYEEMSSPLNTIPYLFAIVEIDKEGNKKFFNGSMDRTTGTRIRVYKNLKVALNIRDAYVLDNEKYRHSHKYREIGELVVMSYHSGNIVDRA